MLSESTHDPDNHQIPVGASVRCLFKSLYFGMVNYLRIKICCISSIAEAQMAVKYGANAVGLVSAMPSGPGVIPDDRIAEIVPHIPPGVDSVLLTCARDEQTIVAQQRRFGVNTLQLVDNVDEETLKEVRAALPGIGLVRVIHVTGPEAIDDALRFGPLVDGLLLDSGNPKAAVRVLGGTGRVHDWAISRAIVEKSPVPVYLAGGLRPENVADAVRQVRPYGIDVCSGVRVDWKLNEARLAEFVRSAREAQRSVDMIKETPQR